MNASLQPLGPYPLHNKENTQQEPSCMVDRAHGYAAITKLEALMHEDERPASQAMRQA